MANSFSHVQHCWKQHSLIRSRHPHTPIPTTTLVLLLALGHDILFGSIDIIVASRNSGTLRIAQPRILVGAVPARVHVPDVGHVAPLQAERALVRQVTRPRCGRHILLAVPRLVRGQLLQRLRVRYPGQGLCHGHKVDVRSKEEEEESENGN